VIGGSFGDDTQMAGDAMRTASIPILLLCAVAALSACNRDSSSAPADNAGNAATRAKPKAPSIAKAGPTAAEQTAGMVQAATQGKSQLPVELKFDLGARPKVGQVLEINLALIAQIPANSITLQANGADDLTVAPEASQFDIPAEEAGGVYRQTLKVTPNAEGVSLVGVTVSLKHDDITEQRVFSIPIIAER
jgi:hypothetical protein